MSLKQICVVVVCFVQVNFSFDLANSRVCPSVEVFHLERGNDYELERTCSSSVIQMCRRGRDSETSRMSSFHMIPSFSRLSKVADVWRFLTCTQFSISFFFVPLPLIFQTPT